MARYGIAATDLKRAARNLQIGQGISQRMDSVDAEQFILQGESWADAQCSDFVAVPLRPTPAPGESAVPATPTTRNYPVEFVLAATYFALARMLASEYFEDAPNSSQSAQFAETAAERHVRDFRSRRHVLVGAGRRVHHNPFMPPHIAPREDGVDQMTGGAA